MRGQRAQRDAAQAPRQRGARQWLHNTRQAKHSETPRQCHAIRLLLVPALSAASRAAVGAHGAMPAWPWTLTWQALERTPRQHPPAADGQRREGRQVVCTSQRVQAAGCQARPCAADGSAQACWEGSTGTGGTRVGNKQSDKGRGEHVQSACCPAPMGERMRLHPAGPHHRVSP